VGLLDRGRRVLLELGGHGLEGEDLAAAGEGGLAVGLLVGR
jgi:hypothetical protein